MMHRGECGVKAADTVNLHPPFLDVYSRQIPETPNNKRFGRDTAANIRSKKVSGKALTFTRNPAIHYL